jgi:hypothetical protein
MKKCFRVIAVVSLFAAVAAAQHEVPRSEVFLGYTYVRANQFNQNFGLGQTIGGYDMGGGSGQFIYNFNKWISAVADAGAVHKPNIGVINVENTTAFTLFGPRVSWRRGRITPYGQVLFGAAYRQLSRRLNVVTGLTTPILPPVVTPLDLFPGPGVEVTARLTGSETAFAMAAGGGLDIRVSKHFSFRPVSVDYVLTRFPSLTTGENLNQNSIRASAGFLFTFGEQ